MYWTKRLLAHAGILRVVDVKYNDGKIWQGEIVDEDSEHFCIKAFQMWGLYGRRLCNWVPKSDPGIGNVRWNDRAKLTLTAALLLIAAAPYVAVYQIASVSDSIADIDSFTGLPVADHIYYPDLLPDGHYTVVKATSSGATIIVRRDPTCCCDALINKNAIFVDPRSPIKRVDDVLPFICFKHRC